MIVLLTRRLVVSDGFVTTRYKRVLLAATPSCSFANVREDEETIVDCTSSHGTFGGVARIG